MSVAALLRFNPFIQSPFYGYPGCGAVKTNVEQPPQSVRKDRSRLASDLCREMTTGSNRC